MGRIYVIEPFMLVLSGVICRRPEFKSGQRKNSPNGLLPICRISALSITLCIAS